MTEIKLIVQGGEYIIINDNPNNHQVGDFINIDFQGGIDLREIIKIVIK